MKEEGMKNIGLKLVIVAIALVMIVGAAGAQGVYNVTLSPVGSSGINGSASTIAGMISGPNPYANVEINANMNVAPAANMVYEGWLVNTALNTRSSLGVFTGSTLSTRIRLTNFSASGPYNAIAVSLEPANSTNPLPTTIVAQGNLPGNAVAAANFPCMAVMPADEALQQQLIMQRYGLTAQQVATLRMQGWSYNDINLIANAAIRCNNSPSNIANMLAQGQSWNQIASTCNTTVATLMSPMVVTVAGTQQQVGTAAPIVAPLIYYRTYGNGTPIVTAQVWEYWQRRGYTWQDVAVAANIASVTGEDIGTLLRMTKLQGFTWRQIALNRGIDPDVALDVSSWPFSRNGESTMYPSTSAVAGTQMQTPNTAGGSCY
jgi:uncharacterized protein (DUF2062 family)